MNTYRLGSGPMVNAPGLIAWAVNGAAFIKDRPVMVRIVSETWGVPADAARKLVTKQVAYKVDHDAVVFTA